MIRRITVNDLMKMPEPLPFADVRTPAEFTQGHIPGADNIPLFTNEERVLVGTTYKKVGKEAAILLGFDLSGPKWSDFIRQALVVAPEKKIALHCWRGGMRSGAMAWALDLYGFEVYLLDGGYKHYRRWVLRQFEEPYQLCMVGGMTGSGKTTMLHHLKAMGEQVIDLEDLAQHQGSSYGTLNRMLQPTQEQFENNFAGSLAVMHLRKKIWVEDESRTIGKRVIPKPFWDQMQTSVLFDLQLPLAHRVDRLVETYGPLDKEFLVTCTDRIRMRLGTEQAKLAIAAIREGRMDEFVTHVLVYYDKSYKKGLTYKVPSLIFPFELTEADMAVNTRKIIQFAQALPADTHIIV